MINIIVLISIVALTILTHYKGSRILLTALVSFYPAAMIYAAIPSKTNLLFLGTKGDSLFYSHALIFGVIFAALFYAVYQITQHEGMSFGVGRWINGALVSSAFVLLVVALTLHILPAYDLFELGAKAQGFWASNTGYLIALCAPVIAIWRVSRW